MSSAERRRRARLAETTSDSGTLAYLDTQPPAWRDAEAATLALEDRPETRAARRASASPGVHMWRAAYHLDLAWLYLHDAARRQPDAAACRLALCRARRHRIAARLWLRLTAHERGDA